MILLKMSANGCRTAAVFFNSLKKMSSCEAYVSASHTLKLGERFMDDLG